MATERGITTYDAWGLLRDISLVLTRPQQTLGGSDKFLEPHLEFGRERQSQSPINADGGIALKPW